MDTQLKVTVQTSLFALAMIGFGIQQFVFGQVTMTRVPETLGGTTMAFVTGTLIVVASVLLLTKKKVWVAVGILAVIILVWAVIPRTLGALEEGTLGGTLTNLLKGLILLSGSFVMGKLIAGDVLNNSLIRWVAASCRYFVVLFLILCGIQHFMFDEFVKTLVPSWIPPSQIFWTYFAGVALIAGGLGILIPKTFHLAARLSGLMIFIWFLILHIPRAIADPYNPGEWAGCSESLAISAIIFATVSLSAKEES